MSEEVRSGRKVWRIFVTERVRLSRCGLFFSRIVFTWMQVCIASLPRTQSPKCIIG